ncbi:zinc finger protein 600-like [Argiope bruennichi]|uniref:zinc finger protein 600-like n=1 Tax=Argiope bruennichi TaxID=94029 RepID=UPI002493DF43|nr:zinc finger protein 600-like [Argiope bruennichi]
MRLENSKWQSLKNDKNNFIYSLECVINKAISDCKKNSGTANLIANPDLPSGSEEPENGKRQVSEGETNEHISLEVHSQGHNKNKKMATYVKDPIPFKEDDNAVAGPSGMSPHEKKFSCSLCSKEFNYKYNLYRHYLTHIGDKPYKCDVCEKPFSRKSHRDRHFRIHTGETPYECEVCGKKFNLKGNRDTHYRTHTCDRPFVCDVCNKGFIRKDHLIRHNNTKHTAERNAF